MAENTYKSNTFKKPEKPEKEKEKKSKKKDNQPDGDKKSFLQTLKDPRVVLATGFVFIIASLFLFTSFLSYLFTGKADQSVLEALNSETLVDAGLETENWLGLWGAIVSHAFIFRWFGIAAFFIPPIFFLIGFRLAFKRSLTSILNTTLFAVFSILWLSLLFGYITLQSDGISEWGFLGGGLGYNLAKVSESVFGWGTFLILILALLIFIIFYFNVTAINLPAPKGKAMGNAAFVKETEQEENIVAKDDEPLMPTYNDEKDIWPDQLSKEEIPDPVLITPAITPAGSEIKLELNTPEPETKKPNSEPLFTIEEKAETDKIAEQLVEEQGAYDPTLELSDFKFPPLELLKEYEVGKVQVTQDELNQNKDKIVATLVNFKIGIQSIKATIGPTVTLYEIVPDAGIKISRIKNLEDDIALSLSALGIRIIAPIPGKGTIGIEVPNKNREMVSIRSVLSIERFQKTEYELPIALGKTISNEVHIIDLAKMPHLLVAGATGQGKSVGLNVILTSLLYKRHPSTLKFVLVDPKKVEMSIYSKIERHYLAKLPNSEEAIITDTKKVVHTLNSLCIEMENRYEILKDAGARNLKEYNAKFVGRKLNPKEGHRFLPYIVLVIDELADLMMTAGKEVETPIARLAQLARAIGIHLVVATQRPSVNVITGVIKANFPARLSFRVTSKVDSRTILDTGGADQLVGQGDMLLSNGSDTIRLQCPFVDTPEIDKVCDFIGSQRGYDSAYLLPEFEGEDEGGVGDIDLSDRDVLFEDAARLIVMHQQGSTSLIQRKMKLGYNRAGRLIDQLEAAGIVGAFEGSKAREVLIKDEMSLEQLLSGLREKHGQ
jgi:S-DNA-T family DNA segregation ATPase FtsK/SpoIIIE